MTDTDPAPAPVAPPAAPPPPPWTEEKNEWMAHIQRLMPQALENIEQGSDNQIFVNPTMILPLVKALRDDSATSLNLLLFVSAIDYVPTNTLEIVYQLSEIKVAKDLTGWTPKNLTLKCRLDRNNAEIDSVVSIHTGADWHERETWEMYGVNFAGHPDLRHLLLYDGFTGNPLRKDYDDPLMIPLPPPLSES